jgi:hypothetical protein
VAAAAAELAAAEVVETAAVPLLADAIALLPAVLLVGTVVVL